MATRQGLIDRLRLETSDFAFAFHYTSGSDGVQVRYDLPHENITSSLVYDNATLLTAGTDYVLDATHGIIVLTTALTSGNVLTVDGFYSELFSDDEYGTWIDTAFALHIVDRNPVPTLSTLAAPEDYLVVMLAKVEVLWVLATNAAYDIDIRTTEGVSIPRSQRFAQMMALINGVKGQYKEWANNLNVGPGRIQNLRLRRVSRITNRYVPVYLTREIDDILPPQRVFPEIDAMGADIAVPTIPTYDISLIRGKSYSEMLTFRDEAGTGLDMTGYTFRAVIHRSQTENVEVDTFEVLETDLVNGQITLVLTNEQTAEFEPRSSLVYNLFWVPVGGNEEPVLNGDILVEFVTPTEV